MYKGTLQCRDRQNGNMKSVENAADAQKSSYACAGAFYDFFFLIIINLPGGLRGRKGFLSVVQTRVRGSPVQAAVALSVHLQSASKPQEKSTNPRTRSELMACCPLGAPCHCHIVHNELILELNAEECFLQEVSYHNEPFPRTGISHLHDPGPEPVPDVLPKLWLWSRGTGGRHCGERRVTDHRVPCREAQRRGARADGAETFLRYGWGLSSRGKRDRENVFLFDGKSLGNRPVISRRWPGNGPVTVFSAVFSAQKFSTFTILHEFS